MSSYRARLNLLVLSKSGIEFSCRSSRSYGTEEISSTSFTSPVVRWFIGTVITVRCIPPSQTSTCWCLMQHSMSRADKLVPMDAIRPGPLSRLDCPLVGLAIFSPLSVEQHLSHRPSFLSHDAIFGPHEPAATFTEENVTLHLVSNPSTE